MNGGGAALFGDSEDFVDRQIGRGRRAFAEAVRFSGLGDVQAGSVGFGVHRDAFGLQHIDRAQDATGNRATVGDQDFFEHGITPEGGAGRPAVFRQTSGPSRMEKTHFTPTHHKPPVGASLLAKAVDQPHQC